MGSFAAGCETVRISTATVLLGSRGGSSLLCLKYIIRVKINSQNTTSLCFFFICLSE